MTNCGDSSGSKIAVYVGLGSNVGDRMANLREAIERIRRLNLEITKASSVYETEPVDYAEQPWFLNQVIETKVSPEGASPREVQLTIQAESFLFELLKIEHSMGRERTVANGPRVIDLDLLLFGDTTITHASEGDESPGLGKTEITVPHPRMHERRFVLEPLCEIAPDLIHPVLKKTCRELLARIEDPSQVRVFRKTLQNPPTR
jgi:2-amino-4-hydroxy-6-hydroxymethyldihydropteridine diphosphokinase